VRGCRDDDVAGVRKAFQAGGKVDAAAKQVAVANHHVADVDADPEQDAPVRSRAFGSAAQRLLRFHRAFNRIHRARKLGQHAVAGSVGDAAAVAGDGSVQDRPLRRQHAHGADLVLLRQPAESGDVRGQHGGKSAFDPGTLRHLRRPAVATIVQHGQCGVQQVAGMSVAIWGNAVVPYIAVLMRATRCFPSKRQGGQRSSNPPH
jgi:hypothetical protein